MTVFKCMLKELKKERIDDFCNVILTGERVFDTYKTTLSLFALQVEQKGTFLCFHSHIQNTL
jgi:hypothetical protein